MESNPQNPDADWMTDPDVIERLFHAISIDDEDGALQLLAAGVSPLTTYQTAPNRKPTAFEFATECEHYDASSPDVFRKLIPAMLELLTQAQKDDLLVKAVQKDLAPTVRALLDGGADGRQMVGGWPLVQLAPNGATEIRRMLRAIDTAAVIESAMGNDVPHTHADALLRFTRADDTAAAIDAAMGGDETPAPAKPSFTL